MRIICSGGGTGGHIFPAVAVAQEITQRYPDAEILFIGAKGKMEMTKVPKAGFPIRGLWISGFQRALTFKNLLFPFKLGVSIYSAIRILNKFNPDVVAGFGGYASGAAVWSAATIGIPTLIMEQNSLPGMTNRILNGKAGTACLAYEESRKYFDKSKVVITGNPIRKSLLTPLNRLDCIRKLGLDNSKKSILIIGGSLGSKSINEALGQSYDELSKMVDVQVLWQCGSGYYDHYKGCKVAQLDHVYVTAFIEDMAVAYGATDLVICRAGALSLAEIMHLGKAAILVPSPNVAEDHQTVNAMTLVDKDAGILVKDNELDSLVEQVLALLQDEKQLKRLEKNAKILSMPDATLKIVDEIEMLVRK